MGESRVGEFGFIDQIKSRFDVPAGIFGIGDDCAVLPAGDEDWLVSTDMLLEGVHFLRSASSAEDVGWKTAAVNLSDVAAMGGTPKATFLSVGFPKDAQGTWAERFIEGYAAISKIYQVPLLGGDTTSSLRDIALNVGVLGTCPRGTALYRSGARVGDTIFVTGALGDSAGGLQAILKNLERTPLVQQLVERHLRPMPRVKEGMALRETGCVGAMMDISDGIASDLRHILKASGVGAEVYLDQLPISTELKTVCQEQGWDLYELAAGGGEDFELLFTAPADLVNRVDFPIFPIGKIVAGQGVKWQLNGNDYTLKTIGYQHF
ncbi:MAG: thiamine-phosphate kinase [Bacteroidales bacterium]|nr:thiamine-phosphate kinase [Bacteroidales bacterium]